MTNKFPQSLYESIEKHFKSAIENPDTRSLHDLLWQTTVNQCRRYQFYCFYPAVILEKGVRHIMIVIVHPNIDGYHNTRVIFNNNVNSEVAEDVCMRLNKALLKVNKTTRDSIITSSMNTDKSMRSDTVAYLSDLKDHYANEALNLETDISNKELLREKEQNESNLEEIRKNISTIEQCMKWAKNS